MSDKTIETEGVVVKIHGNNNYTVATEIPTEDEEEVKSRDVLCHLGGKMRRYKISVLEGDQVKVTIPPPYNLGRITFREKGPGMDSGPKRRRRGR